MDEKDNIGSGSFNLDELGLEDLSLDDLVNMGLGDLGGLDIDGIDSPSAGIPQEVGIPANENSDSSALDEDAAIAEAESLLASLELDDDVIDLDDILDLEKELANDPVFTESLEMLNSISPEEFSKIERDRALAFGIDEEDIDQGISIMDAMIREQLEELSQIPEDVMDIGSGSLESSVSVYGIDDSEVDTSGLTKKEPRPLPKFVVVMLGMPTKYMYVATAVLVVLLSATTVFGYTLLFGDQAQRRAFEQAGGVFLTLPVPGMVNNAFRIFLDGAHADIAGVDTTGLVYALFDSRESVFGLNTPVDTSYTNFYILQDNGEQRLISLQGLEAGPTDTLRLQSLSEGTQEFLLVSIDTRTQERSQQEFRFDRPLIHPPIRHISERHVLGDEGADGQRADPVSVSIEGAYFSPTGTSVTYSVVRDSGLFAAFEVSITDTDTGGLTLREGFGTVGGTQQVVAFDGGAVILANAQLAPLRSLAQPVDIEISGVGQNHIPNLEFPVADLLTGVNPRYIIPFGHYDVFIEGMAHSGRHGMFVLVFHTQDTQVELPYDPQDLLSFLEDNEGNFRSDMAATAAFFRRYGIDPYFNRVETVMRAHLLVETPLGPVRVEGEAVHDRRGSDVLFRLEGFPDFVREAPLSYTTLVIEELDILRPSLGRQVDLGWEATAHPNLFNQSFFNDVIANLSPPPGFAGIYNAELLFGAVHGERMYAVVREMYMSSFYEPMHLTTRRVYAERRGGGAWVIVENHVID